MRIYPVASLLLLSLFIATASCGGEDSGDSVTNGETSPSTSASPDATAAPTLIDEPESASKDRAERGLLQLGDLPSGFFDQGTEISGAIEGNPSLLALATRSFGGQPTVTEALGGGIISLNVIVLVMSDEGEAQGRVAPDALQAAAAFALSSVHDVVNPETREISFISLGDESTAVELLGTGTVAGQRVDIVFRTVGIRQGNIVGVINITGLTRGPISELENLAAKLADRLEDAAN